MSSGKFQQPIAKLGPAVKQDQENGVWRFEIVAPEKVGVAVDERTIGDILGVAVDSLNEALIRENMAKIQSYVANAEMAHWPRELGVFRDE